MTRRAEDKVSISTVPVRALVAFLCVIFANGGARGGQCVKLPAVVLSLGMARLAYRKIT